MNAFAWHSRPFNSEKSFLSHDFWNTGPHLAVSFEILPIKSPLTATKGIEGPLQPGTLNNKPASVVYAGWHVNISFGFVFCSCWNTNPKSWTVWIYRVPIVLMNLVRWQINLIKCSYKARMLPFHLSIALWPDMHAVRPWLMLISLSCRLTSSISSKL